MNSEPDSYLPSMLNPSSGGPASLLRRRKLIALKVNTNSRIHQHKANPSKLLRDMKQNYSKRKYSEGDRHIDCELSKEIRYIFISPEAKNSSKPEQAISDFLNDEGIFQLNLAQAFEM
mmetsp:Transcript_22981/g.22828  ORF Transcript_22981/g.22828 Transcript_22981/m.22828 type:complete len:118 (-) Transcript_22981:146-499(-)